MSFEVVKDYSGRDYRTVWQAPRADFEDRFEAALIRRLAPSEPGWFLDLGAGYGRLLPLYERPGRRVVLVDYALNLLELAAETYAGRDDVDYVAANAYHLPFRGGSFAAALSVRAFHHMTAPQRFFEELARVVRPGAGVLLEYSNKRNLLRLLRFGRSSLRRDHEEYGDLLFGTHPEHFAQLAAGAGFGVGRTLGTGFLSRVVGERTRGAFGLLAAAETAADALLGPALTPMNFAQLRRLGADAAVGEGSSLAALLQCPACGGELADAGGGMRCAACEREFPRVGAVVDLRHRP